MHRRSLQSPHLPPEVLYDGGVFLPWLPSGSELHRSSICSLLPPAESKYMHADQVQRIIRESKKRGVPYWRESMVDDLPRFDKKQSLDTDCAMFVTVGVNASVMGVLTGGIALIPCVYYGYRADHFSSPDFLPKWVARRISDGTKKPHWSPICERSPSRKATELTISTIAANLLLGPFALPGMTYIGYRLDAQKPLLPGWWYACAQRMKSALKNQSAIWVSQICTPHDTPIQAAVQNEDVTLCDTLLAEGVPGSYLERQSFCANQGRGSEATSSQFLHMWGMYAATGMPFSLTLTLCPRHKPVWTLPWRYGADPDAMLKLMSFRPDPRNTSTSHRNALYDTTRYLARLLCQFGSNKHDTVFPLSTLSTCIHRARRGYFPSRVYYYGYEDVLPMRVALGHGWYGAVQGYLRGREQTSPSIDGTLLIHALELQEAQTRYEPELSRLIKRLSYPQAVKHMLSTAYNRGKACMLGAPVYANILQQYTHQYPSWIQECVHPHDVSPAGADFTNLYRIYTDAHPQKLVKDMAALASKKRLKPLEMLYLVRTYPREVASYRDRLTGNTFLHVLAHAPALAQFVPLVANLVTQEHHSASNRVRKTPSMIAQKEGNDRFMKMMRLCRLYCELQRLTYRHGSARVACQQDVHCKQRIPSEICDEIFTLRYGDTLSLSSVTLYNIRVYPFSYKFLDRLNWDLILSNRSL